MPVCLAGATVAVGALSGCAALLTMTPKPSPADSLVASSMLDQTLTAYWRHVLVRRPALGLADGVLASTLPDPSFEASRSDARAAQRITRSLDAINADALDPDQYVTLLGLRWELDARGEAATFFWSDFAALSPAETPLREITEVFTRHPLASPASAERYLYLLDLFPLYTASIRAGLEERRTRGYVAPRELVESGIRFLRGLRALGEGGPWAVPAARLAALDTVDARAFAAEADAAITLRLLPSLDSLAAWLERDYLPSASPRVGLWQYPGGKEHYRHLLRRHTSLDILPEEAHQVGVAELRRVDSLMAAVRAGLAWRGTLEAFHDSLRRAGAATPFPLDSARAQLLDAQRRATAALGERFVRFPAIEVQVRAATPLEALLHPDGAYREAGDSSAPERLLLTPRWTTPGARRAIASRSYQLLVPGRFMQRSLALHGRQLPAFRRLHESDGYVAGWMQYAASLAGEAGLYVAPGDAYGRLLDEGLASALLVVDTGVHYLGWSKAQALALLRRYSLESDAALDTLFAERIAAAPGRAASATLGARELAAMRAWLARELRDDFDERRWHDAVLTAGALPLPILAAYLEQWLFDEGRVAAERRRAASDSSGARR